MTRLRTRSAPRSLALPAMLARPSSSSSWVLLLRAGSAGAGQRHVAHVHGETQVGRQTFRRAVEHPRVGRADLAAGLADDVQVGMLRGVVDRRTLPQVGVPHQAEPLEQLEGAVDRGGARRGAVRAGLVAQPRVDLLRGAVLQRGDRGQHPLALAGQPQPAGPQLRSQRWCALRSGHGASLAREYGRVVPVTNRRVAIWQDGAARMVGPAEPLRQRDEGVSAVSLSLGIPADFRATAPWLLGGAKTLSYAVNMAAQRHAHAAGADDVVFTSLEGRLLE